MKNIIDYRFLTTEDSKCDDYNSWSRIYEYQVVLDFINKTKSDNNIEVHNSAWGTDDNKKWGAAKDHVRFRDSITSISKSAIHSDIIDSINFNTYKYNILEKEEEFKNKFDYVLNISVIEHLDAKDQVIALNNLYEQVKEGGYFVLTFDYPRVNFKVLNEFIGERVDLTKPVNTLNGKNSIKPDNRYHNLNIVLLIIKKDK